MPNLDCYVAGRSCIAKGTKVSEQETTIKWYAASALFVAQVQGEADRCPLLVEERVYLIAAANDDDALNKATSFAKQEVSAEGEYPSELHGKPSRDEFVGIRKLMTVRRHVTDHAFPDQEVADGCEATFSFFEIADRQDLQQLVSGDAVELTYLKEPQRG
jgi:uncharacterized protein DUF4288